MQPSKNQMCGIRDSGKRETAAAWIAEATEMRLRDIANREKQMCASGHASDEPRIGRIANRGHKTTDQKAEGHEHSFRGVNLMGILIPYMVVFWGVVFSLAFLLSGCEFIYLPECARNCTAAGGNDSYAGAEE